MIDINFGQTHLFIKLQQKYNSIHIVMVQARHPGVDLIVSVVTGRDAIIGQVLYFTKQAAQALSES